MTIARINGDSMLTTLAAASDPRTALEQAAAGTEPARQALLRDWDLEAHADLRRALASASTARNTRVVERDGRDTRRHEFAVKRVNSKLNAIAREVNDFQETLIAFAARGDSEDLIETLDRLLRRSQPISQMDLDTMRQKLPAAAPGSDWTYDDGRFDERGFRVTGKRVGIVR